MRGHIGKTTNWERDVIGSQTTAERESQWGPLDGVVTSYDAAKNTVNVKPTYKPTHDGQLVDMPELVEVPINWARTGSGALTFPIPNGTRVRLTPQMRSSENYHVDGSGEPSDKRSFALSDMEASIVGGDSLTDPLSNVDTENTHLRFSPDGTFGMKGNEQGEVRIRADKIAFQSTNEDAFVLVQSAIDLCSQGFTLLGTESLDHAPEYASIGSALAVIAGKLETMSLTLNP